MIATPGVTNAHPVNWSEARTRLPAARTPRGRFRRRTAGLAATSARSEHLVDLLRSGLQGFGRLALVQQHRHDHLPEDLGDLRVLRNLRPRLLDVGQVRD